MTSDAYYGAGSDNFRGYVWKIPKTSVLLEQRKETSADRWPLEGDDTVGMGNFARSSHVVIVHLSWFFLLSVCEIRSGNTSSAGLPFPTAVPVEW